MTTAHANSAATRERLPARPAVASADARRRGFAAAGLAAALVLGACSSGGPPVAAYRHLDDQAKAVTGGLYGYPCRKEGHSAYGWRSSDRTPDDECYRFDPPRRMRGIWVLESADGLDTIYLANFVENANDAPRDLFASRPRTWPANMPNKINEQALSPGVYRVEMIARKTSIPGRYGFTGATSEVFVEKLISIRRLPTPKGSSLDPANEQGRPL